MASASAAPGATAVAVPLEPVPAEYTDPLDNPDFNALEYVNRLLPNEESLVNLDKVLQRLRMKIRKIDSEIREVVRSQTDAGERGKMELEEAKRVILDLFTRIEHIKTKAVQSEQMVQEITADIKQLDNAKRHLTASITALKRMNMLVSAVEQLKSMSQRRQYREAASILQAVQQLISYFKAYKQISKIQHYSNDIAIIQGQLGRQVKEEFDKSFSPQGLLLGQAQVLQDACLVASILDPDVRKYVVDWYIELQLRDYRNTFRGTEVGSLENTPLRYSWLSRTMKAREEEIALIFPSSWNVLERWCEQFCDDTRRDLSTILSISPDLDVKAMLQTLQKTVDFEQLLAKKFSTTATGQYTRDGKGLEDDKDAEDELRAPVGEEDDDIIERDPHSVDAIKAKYRKHIREKKRAEAMKNPETALRFETIPAAKFIGLISSCYEQYLSHYIELENRNVQDLLDRFRQQPESEEGLQVSVFSSSMDLFMFYKKSLQGCQKLSKRKPLLDLSKMFANNLMAYASFLKSRFPRDPDRVLPEDEFKRIAFILNTADYCHTNVTQLQAKIKEKIDPSLAEQVDFNQPLEEFLGLTVSAIAIEVRALQAAVSVSLSAMSRIQWSTFDSVGDQSQHVTEMVATMKERVNVVRNAISGSKFFKQFCIKFIESFAPLYVNTIHKCKPISEVGTEQMLLDTHALKTSLMDLPNFGNPEPTSVPSTYTKLVAKNMQKAEMLLKCILSPLDPPDALVDNYLLIYADNNLANFMRVLELKGIKKAEQQVFIDLFSKHLPAPPSGGAGVLAPAPAEAAAKDPLQALRMGNISKDWNKLLNTVKRPGGKSAASSPTVGSGGAF